MSYERSANGVATAMKTSRNNDVFETARWCLLLIKFVSCHGLCDNCSVDHLKSRRSVRGGC